MFSLETLECMWENPDYRGETCMSHGEFPRKDHFDSLQNNTNGIGFLYNPQTGKLRPYFPPKI